MDLRADLHLHTVASDGCWTPEQLVGQLRQAGIDLFAITDHDSLGSLAKALEQVQGSGLRFLPGVELSSRLNGQWYHLLAYGIDPSHPGLGALVESNASLLAGAGDQAVELLARAGYDISLDDYAAYTWDRARGGWKSINFLQDLGFCHDVPSYFGGLFAEIPHPEADFPAPGEVIATARQAGGVVVLAHPGAYFPNGVDIRRLDELVDMGVEGLECYTSHHDRTATRSLVDYCRRRGLLITGGSDCHGDFAGRSLGVPVITTGELRLGPLEEMILT